MKFNPKHILLVLLFIFFLNLSFLGLRLSFFKEDFIIAGIIIFALSLLFCLTFFVFWVFSFLPQNIKIDERKNYQLFIFLVFLFCSFLIFLWFGLNIYTLLAGLAFPLFMFFAFKSIKNTENLFLKFDFGKIFKASKWSFLTAFAILIAIIGFLSPKIVGGRVEFSRDIYNFIFPEIEERLANKYPGFSGEMTLDEFVLLVYLKNPPKNFPIKKTDKEIRNYLEFKHFFISFKKQTNKKDLDKFLKIGRKEILKSIIGSSSKKEFTGNEKMKEVFYQIASDWFEESAKHYQYVAGINAGLILFFFFIARFVLSLISIFFLPIAWFLFKFLKFKKFFEIKIEKVDKEKIII